MTLSHICGLVLHHVSLSLFSLNHFVNYDFHYFFHTQIKRNKALSVFDLDKIVVKTVTTTLRYHLTPEEAVRIEVRNYISRSLDVYNISKLSCRC